MSPSPATGLEVEQADRLTPEDVGAVLDLLRRATDADGVAPLSEHVLLHLRRGGQEPGRHLLVRDTAAVVGYAHLDPTDSVDGSSAELVVDPDHRRRGHGRRLVNALMRLADQLADGRLRLWAHGESPDAGPLAEAMGFVRVRELWQMRRSLNAALPREPVPAGVRLRTFEPGDEEAVLALNASAFADHPEQGRWRRADLDARTAEDWFDPAGLFLAESDGAEGADGAGGADGEGGAGEGHEAAAGDGVGLLAFHWTKVHGVTRHAHDGGDHAHEPIGEVYVVGVSPRAQGRGLGRFMTLVGLRHLRALGLTQAMLYVDADNEAAVRTYTTLGFVRWDIDVQFRRQVGAGRPV